MQRPKLVLRLAKQVPLADKDLVGEPGQREKEVLLSAVVVTKKERIPGEGFFLFARHDLGLEFDDESEFWQQQRDAVYAADWS